MTLHVLIDGDNIHLDTFLTYIKPNVDKLFGREYIPVLFCQTNVLIKYRECRTASVQICCSKTSNKNASDARILVEIGKLQEKSQENIIVIVSNDRIFEEVADSVKVHIMTYVNKTKTKKLKRKNVLDVLQDLNDAKESQSDDIYIDDLCEHFKGVSKLDMKGYIVNSVPELRVSSNDVIFYGLGTESANAS